MLESFTVCIPDGFKYINPYHEQVIYAVIHLLSIIKCINDVIVTETQKTTIQIQMFCQKNHVRRWSSVAKRIVIRE